MKIPFTKAHGAKNDFLLTFASGDLNATPEIARAICDRHTGAGADGWMLITHGGDGCDGATHLFNSDGSVAEMSGNGTRCAAALLIRDGIAGENVRLRTGAGLKELRLLAHEGLRFQFEMNMGRPEVVAKHFTLLDRDVTLLWVGNPQCVVPVENFDFDWRTLGAQMEAHPHFPNRTNVSFVRAVDDHTIEARFYERGAGETMSSGTGSTGAVAAAILRGMAKSPVEIRTPAGPMSLRWDDDIYLTGPAEIVADGVFFL